MKYMFYKLSVCLLLPTSCVIEGMQNGCTADFIIVGYGTAGGLLTRRLSDPDENGQFVNSVLTLEEGQNYTSDPAVVDVNIFTVATSANQAYINPKYSRRYVVPLSPNIPEQNFEYGYGRMWGGSGGHDFLLAVRGSYDIFDDWAAITGDSRWLSANLIPTFAADENYVGVTQVPAERGNGTSAGGFLTITQFPQSSLSFDPFAQAIQTGTNTPILDDYNVTGADLSISANQNFIIQTNTPNFGDGIRQFSPNFLDSTMVSPEGLGLNGRKLRIQSGATVVRIIFSGTKAIGVEYILNNNPEEVFYAFARKKIILSAGALSDCAILQRSGIGDPAVLIPLGIPVIVNNPLVGVGLQTHYGIIGAMLNDGEVPYATPGGLLWSDLSYQFPAPVAGDELRDWQFIFIPANALDPKINTSLGFTFATPMITFVAWNLRPQAVGTITIQDTDPLNIPRVRYNLYSDGPFTTPGTDQAQAVQAFRVINSIATAAGLTMAYPLPAHFASDALLFADALASYSVTNHYSGSCNMGSSIADGVVDGQGNVFGVTNLAVGDLSIAPTSPTGNTRLAAMIIGEKVAQANGAIIPT